MDKSTAMVCLLHPVPPALSSLRLSPMCWILSRSNVARRRRYCEWRSRIECGLGSAHRILHRSHEATRRGLGPAGNTSGSIGDRLKTFQVLESAGKLVLAGAGPGLQNQRGALRVEGGVEPHYA